MKVFRQPRAGVTELSRRFVENHLAQIGKVEQVKTYVDEQGDYITEVVGSEGKIIVDGFAWGYGGEGPHGLLWLLRDVLGGEVTIQEIAKVTTDGHRATLWDCRNWKPKLKTVTISW